MHKYSISTSLTVRIRMRKRLLQLLTAAITLTGIFAFAASAPASAATPKPAKLTISPGSYQHGTVMAGTSSATAALSIGPTAKDFGQTPIGDTSNLSHQASFTVSGTSTVPPPDLSTAARVASENFTNAAVTITVTNLGGANSVAATMTIDVDPTQSFSYEAGAGSDCTAKFVNGSDSVFTCPVPVIAPGATYTRTLTIQNLSGQAPHYVQTTATTIMTGDTNSSNNTGYALVTFG
jgi:hypothetical protein